MRTRPVVTAIAVAAVAAAASIFLWPFGDFGPDRAAVAPGQDRAAATPAVAASTDAAPTRRTDAGGAPPSAASTAAGADVPQTDRTITLRAVLHDGQVAAGARVDVGAVQPRVRYERGSRDTANDPPPVATFVAAADGTVRLPWQHAELGHVPITVQLGSARGDARIATSAPSGSEHVVTLAPDLTLPVLVVGADDQPAAGVDVHVRAAPHGAFAASEPIIAWMKSGADGTATFAHVQRWPENVRTPMRTFGISSRLPGIDEAGVVVDIAALPRQVVLRIPATGRVDVTAQAPDGSPLGKDYAIVLEPVNAESFALAPCTPPVTTFAHVPIGRKWTASIAAFSDRVEFDGPAIAGESVAVTLRAVPHTVLTGRVVRDGAPAAGALLSFEHVSVGAWKEGTLAADAGGRFELTQLPGRERVTSIRVATKDEHGIAWVAMKRLDREFAHGTHDLGDFPLRRVDAAPLMVSGRVVAPCGLDDVWLEVHGSDRAVDVQLAPDGTFKVFGEDPGTPLKLRASADNHRPGPDVAFTFGQTGVEVTLRAGVRLHATLAVPSFQLAECLDIGLDAVDDEHGDYAAPPDLQTTALGGAVACEWAALEPGDYRLVVRLRGHDNAEPLAEAAITLPPNVRDVHAPKLVLPDARVLRLRLPKPIGMTSMSGTRVWRVAGENTFDAGVEAAPDLWLVAATEPIDLRVFVPGYRLRTLHGLFADTTVALDPAIVVDLACDAPRLPDGTTMRVNATHRDLRLGIDAAVENGRARLALPAAGTWALQAELGSSADGTSYLRCEPEELTVHEHGGTFTIRMRADDK